MIARIILLDRISLLARIPPPPQLQGSHGCPFPIGLKDILFLGLELHPTH